MNFYEFYKLINEYGRNTLEFLVQKFQKEQPGLNRNTIELYVQDFDKIKNKLQNKDVTTYSWRELETTVDANRPKPKIKAGKLEATVSDANLLYNKDGIVVYLGRDKKSCVRYGNGYTFCISARGERNMYGSYRIEQKGTPYFIFNDNLPESDTRHLIIIFVYENNHSDHPYTVTKADNRVEDAYKDIEEIINDYPWVKNVKNLIKSVEPDPREILEHKLNTEHEIIKNMYFNYERNANVVWEPVNQRFKKDHYLYSHFKSMIRRNLDVVDDILADKKRIANVDFYILTKWATGVGFEKPTEKIENADGFTYIIQQIVPYNNVNDIIKSIMADISSPDLIDEIGHYSVERIKQELIKNRNKIEEILNNNKDFAPPVDMKQIPDNTIVLPYSIISLGSPTEIIKQELKSNIDNIKTVKEIDNKYKKQIHWVRNVATNQELKKVIESLPITNPFGSSFDYSQGEISKIIEKFL